MTGEISTSYHVEVVAGDRKLYIGGYGSQVDALEAAGRIVGVIKVAVVRVVSDCETVKTWEPWG
jgi:hypothetical protein